MGVSLRADEPTEGTITMSRKNLCKCSEGMCPCCFGSCWSVATVTVYRVDMEDATGTPMCEGCADDAMDSGLFTTEPPSAQQEDDEDDEPETMEEATIRRVRGM